MFDISKLIASKDYRSALSLPSDVIEKYEVLAQGEYNINYYFQHPNTRQHLVLRVNCGSQMHLENQIEYEYNALRLLEKSERTPKVFYVDGTKRYIDHGILVMEYLPGHSMDYTHEIDLGAEILADIHSIRIDKQIQSKSNARKERSLLSPSDPLRAILKECEQMFVKYFESDMADKLIKDKIKRLLAYGWERLYDRGDEPAYKCCINTELNNTNFLINGRNEKNYLVDWEKPIYGDPAQDIGHFLAPTTTFWKTDTILDAKDLDLFIELYIEKVNGRYDTLDLRKRIYDYIPITCLRGITWCAMAWVKYNEPGREIINESTASKLEQYLEIDFLNRIEELVRK
ncbi:phosphotransferase [Mogibacterium sp.]